MVALNFQKKIMVIRNIPDHLEDGHTQRAVRPICHGLLLPLATGNLNDQEDVILIKNFQLLRPVKALILKEITMIRISILMIFITARNPKRTKSAQALPFM